jgi:tetratricopeptide (TPR) repeat protein
MSTRRWYAPVLVAGVATITIGAAYSFESLQGVHVGLPFLKRGKADAPAQKTPASKHVAPRVAQPAPQLATAPVVEAPTRAPTVVADAATVTTEPADKPKPRKRAAWVPSERQQLRDKVYLAGKENRPADAIAALEAWDAKHPSDPEVLRELARLLARSPKQYDALARYRELLAIQPDTSVRAEYAAALLAMQQYDSAAANYRILVAGDSNNVSAHLGLARALSWNSHERDAEPELAWLAPRMPWDTTITTMLRLARGSFDPSSEQASHWVAGDPKFAPYQLALARAYVREHQAALAVPAFDTVLAWDANAPLSLVRESASAHAAAGDSVGAARTLKRAVALSPRDSSVRGSYADALAWAGDRQAAIAQYDTLLMAGPNATLLVARARLYAWTGNSASAERDLIAANAVREDAATWAMLGDLYRWRNDRAHARDAYAHANTLNPGEPGALVGYQAIADAERREVAAILARDLGWSAWSTYLGDNQDFSFFSEGLSGAAAIGERTAMTFGADARRLDSMNGESVHAGLVDYVGYLRVTADGGYMHYSQLGDFGFGSLSVSGPLGRSWIASDVRTGPAYQPLMVAGRLTYTGASFSATVPLGVAAVSAGVDQMWLSDGNARTSVQLGARYPLGYGVSALYSGGMIGFNRASDVYWDPRHFTSHALGVEIATHADTGFSFSARVLPGVGLGTELLSGRSDPTKRNAAQLSSGFAIDYRRRWWALTLDGDYAQGVRESGYHSARASVRVRITP